MWLNIQHYGRKLNTNTCSFLFISNDANDSMDMEFISEDRIKKEKQQGDGCGPGDEHADSKVYVVKRPTNCSLLRQYKHSWKTRNNHFQRYSDVKPREERRSSVTELANQRHIVQRVKGWKIYHLSTQFENLVSLLIKLKLRIYFWIYLLAVSYGKLCIGKTRGYI